METPYKVVLERLQGLETPMKTWDQDLDQDRVQDLDQDLDQDRDRDQAVLQRPLEICLKHSTVVTGHASSCPLVRPQPGVAALHEYAEWIVELSGERGGADRELKGQARLLLEERNVMQ